MKAITYKGVQFTGSEYTGSRGSVPLQMEIYCVRERNADGSWGSYRATAYLDGYSIGSLYVYEDGEIEMVKVDKKFRRRRIARALKSALQRAMDKRGAEYYGYPVIIRHSQQLTTSGAAWASAETGVERKATTEIDHSVMVGV